MSGFIVLDTSTKDGYLDCGITGVYGVFESVEELDEWLEANSWCDPNVYEIDGKEKAVDAQKATDTKCHYSSTGVCYYSHYETTERPPCSAHCVI